MSKKSLHIRDFDKNKLNINFKHSASFIINISFQNKFCEDFSCDKIVAFSQAIDRSSSYHKIQTIVKNIIYAAKIEASIFEYTIIYIDHNDMSELLIPAIYNEKLEHILNNLDKNRINNKYLLKSILQGKINPQIVAFLTPQELFPQRWAYCARKKNLRELKQNNMSATDSYPCRKCGARKAKVTQQQTRSADEPMTTFVTCLVCYNVLKF